MSASWWSSLESAEQFFWMVALFATVLQVFLLLGSFLSSADFDHGADMEDGSSAHSAKLISLRALTAFAVGFGWAGVLALGEGMGGLGATVSALIAGIIFTLLFLGTMRFLMSLKADGTLNYKNAVGESGTVYVTIPPRRSGIGQIEVLVQSRLITANAVTDHDRPLAPQAPVRVTAVEAGNTLLVSPS